MGLVLGTSANPLPGPYAVTMRPNSASSDGLDHSWYTTSETAVLVSCLFLGSVLWAYVTSCLVDIIVNTDPDATNFRNFLDDVNRFVGFFKLDRRLAMQLRAYAHERRITMMADSRSSVVSSFSPKLQALVAWESHKEWLITIPFLNLDAQTETLRRATFGARYASIGRASVPSMQGLRVRVALSLAPDLYAPREFVPPRRLYVVVGGLALFKGKTVVEGQHWGDLDVLLRGETVRRTSAVSLTHLHVLSVGPDTIEAVARDFPTQYLEMRMWVLRHALVEYMLHLLRAYRAGEHATPAMGREASRPRSTSHSKPLVRQPSLVPRPAPEPAALEPAVPTAAAATEQAKQPTAPPGDGHKLPARIPQRAQPSCRAVGAGVEPTRGGTPSVRVSFATPSAGSGRGATPSASGRGGAGGAPSTVHRL